MISSDYQAKYIAHELERVYANDDVAKLSGLMFDAQITPTPHQIDAALFALDSPNTRGVIMADEVGLGKTIEAGIVIMQYWAERKRKILIVTPSSLRQQWAQELQEKFNLFANIIDSKSIKNKPVKNDGIYICSYEFANRNVEKLSSGWDLLILDEAHKLRNFYNNKKGVASAISDIAKGASKSLLLTATPLQNRLEELYGLVSVVDPQYFHTLDVFKERYIKTDHPYALDDLRARMSKIAKRTLRTDAKKYIKYTDRIARTVTFNPSGDEKKLYDLVDDYLHRDKLFAFASSQRHLAALIMRKRLGSSSFAVASTLHKIITRMEDEYVNGKVRDNRGGLVEFDDLTDEEIEYYENSGEIDDISLESAKERAEFRAEIDELIGYAKLAESITSNVKAEHLVEAINIGFKTLESRAEKKAIIFTESTLTQEYIAKVLEQQGFANKYVLFNGNNKSQDVNKIYSEWKEKNKDTDLITGIESADRRKALIDKFREDDIQIMIATEAASEGINLQFCSMLINYDLPWNPQRVEQRIGRIHRMGQKYDVVVVNFSNEGNTAEQRILDLLENKFNLFKSTFGASNDVLGAIENGIDFERTISDILNNCRTDEEISQRFEELQEKFKDEIAIEQNSARARIFDGLDPHVQDRFQRYSEQATEAFNSFERMFMGLTRYELRDVAKFEDEHVFELYATPAKNIESGLYFYKTDRMPHARQYKYAGDLAEYVRTSAVHTDTPPAQLTFSISNSERVANDAKKLAGITGTIVVHEVTFPMKAGTTDMSESYIIAAGETTDGQTL
ncbi:MAG: SNF2-related protein [Candidatus Saccharimonadales bacterium]